MDPSGLEQTFANGAVVVLVVKFAESDIGQLRNTCTILEIVDTTAAPALYVLG